MDGPGQGPPKPLSPLAPAESRAEGPSPQYRMSKEEKESGEFTAGMEAGLDGAACPPVPPPLAVPDGRPGPRSGGQQGGRGLDCGPGPRRSSGRLCGLGSAGWLCGLALRPWLCGPAPRWRSVAPGSFDFNENSARARPCAAGSGPARPKGGQDTAPVSPRPNGLSGAGKCRPGTAG